MGFRFQKRINLGSGTGLNVSNSGVSASHRGKFGSVGTRGFSIKTGIPGLSYRAGWGRGKNGAMILLAYIVILVSALVIYNAFSLLFYLLTSLYYLLKRKFVKAEHESGENQTRV